MKYYFLIAALFFALQLFAQPEDIEWELAFSDDFEQDFGAQWILEGEWTLDNQSGNNSLKGSNHRFATCRNGDHWYNYKTRFRLKINSGTVHTNIRINEDGRYYIGLSEGWFYLNQSAGENHHEITTGELTVNTGQWYCYEVVVINDSIWVKKDGELFVKARSISDMNTGTIAFESLDNSEIFIDDVEVYTVKEEQANSDNPWKRLGGPIGGLGYDIRINPDDKNIMLVTDNPSGVNKSYDGGRTWQTRNTGIAAPGKIGAPIFSLTIDPGNPDNQR